MSEEIKGLIEAQGKAFEAFKAKVEQEAKTGDAVVADEVKKLNEALSDIGEKLKAVEIKANRPRREEGELSTEAKAHKEAFSTYLRKGKGEDDLKALETKALTTVAGADGGFAVPEVIDTMIADRLIDISPVRSVATVIQIGTSDYKKLVNRRGTASGWVAETAARPETNTPVLQEIAIVPGELYANPMATQVMLDDVFFDAETWLANEVATEFARAEGAAFISGDGSNKPFGFLSGTPVVTADAGRAAGVLQYIFSGGAAALPTSADTYMDIVAALKAGHRAGSVWMMSKAVVFAIRKLKDTTNQYLWAPGLAGGNPDTFLGYPVVEAEDMPAVGANTFPVAFGNFAAGYQIVDRVGVRTIRDPYSNKPYIGFYTTKRVGGRVVDSEAIKLLKIATS